MSKVYREDDFKSFKFEKAGDTFVGVYLFSRTCTVTIEGFSEEQRTFKSHYFESSSGKPVRVVAGPRLGCGIEQLRSGYRVEIVYEGTKPIQVPSRYAPRLMIEGKVKVFTINRLRGGRRIR